MSGDGDRGQKHGQGRRHVFKGDPNPGVLRMLARARLAQMIGCRMRADTHSLTVTVPSITMKVRLTCGYAMVISNATGPTECDHLI